MSRTRLELAIRGGWDVGYIEGAERDQVMLLPARVEDYVGASAMVRVIAAFVHTLDMTRLGFVRSTPAETGRPGYDPRAMLRLYIYGYLNGARSSRRLERDCRINVELMWLLATLAPDFKTIADFRRDNGAGIVGACKAFVLFARKAGLIAGEVAAIDGTKLAAASSRRRVMSADDVAEAMRRLDETIAAFLADMDARDAAEGEAFDETRTAAALAKLRERRGQLADLAERMAAHERALGVLGEPEARPMGHAAQAKRPAYNVQIAVEAQSHIIVHHDVTTAANDHAQLEPMARAARDALDAETIRVVADAGYANAGYANAGYANAGYANAGYANAGQAAACEAAGIEPAVPAPPSANNTGNYFSADRFTQDPDGDTLTCPAGRTLRRRGTNLRDQARQYRADDCSGCPLKPHCTGGPRRHVSKSLFEDARDRMNARADQAAMRLRRCTAEHPFASLKRTLGGRLLLRGQAKAATETAFAVLAYNLTRVANILGRQSLIERLT